MKKSNLHKTTFSFLLLILFCSCTKQQTISSAEVNERDGRITILSSHIKIESKILDVEYDLFNSSGFDRNSDTGLGPTDTDYKFAIKVKPSDIKKMEKRPRRNKR